MKLLGLARMNMLRSRRRTILTILSVMVALFLYSTLRTVITSFQAGVDFADVNHLVVRNATSLIFPVPLSYRERIAAVDGISAVTFANWFGATYIDERNFFAQFAVERDTYFELYPELVVPPDQLADWKRERTAAIAGEGLANEFGWKIGDQVTLKGTIYPGDWEFVIRGIYRGDNDTVDKRQFFFHWDYLDESNFMGRGNVGVYIVQVRDADLVPAVSQKIDALFANSSTETRTETEEAFQMGFISMLGNIQFAVNLIGFAVIVAIILVAMNTMMMAARERTAEIGVLKILGFEDGTVVAMVVAEAMLIALIGGGLGILIARVLFDHIGFTGGGFFPSFLVRGSTMLEGLAISLLLGALAALWPALRAARLREIEALRNPA